MPAASDVQLKTISMFRSSLALAASMRQFHLLPDPHSNTALPTLGRLVQAYTIQHYTKFEDEAQAVVYTVQHVLDRMRRIVRAYGEWQTFDGSAYFDLNHEQIDLLVHIEERIGTVHCTFFIDPLLPSFQIAQNTFQQTFINSYWLRHHNAELSEHFFYDVQPTMVSQWLRLQRVIAQARLLLASDINFLAMNAADEERWRQQSAWEVASATGVDGRLTPSLRQISTLTVSHEFPLPTYRQPGRRRRLWHNRERKRFANKRRR